MSRSTCTFVTGSSASLGRLEPSRRGDRRDDGRYDVLCGFTADFLVRSTDGDVPVCARCLPYVVRNVLADGSAEAVVKQAHRG